MTELVFEDGETPLKQKLWNHFTSCSYNKEKDSLIIKGDTRFDNNDISIFL